MPYVTCFKHIVLFYYVEIIIFIEFKNMSSVHFNFPNPKVRLNFFMDSDVKLRHRKINEG